VQNWVKARRSKAGYKQREEGYRIKTQAEATSSGHFVQLAPLAYLRQVDKVLVAEDGVIVHIQGRSLPLCHLGRK
jgi:hypothetical protein